MRNMRLPEYVRMVRNVKCEWGRLRCRELCEVGDERPESLVAYVGESIKSIQDFVLSFKSLNLVHYSVCI